MPESKKHPVDRHRLTSTLKKRRTGLQPPGRALGWVAMLSLQLLAVSGARAQDLVTDRPDQTESAETVPAGHIQLELGWTLGRDATSGRETESQQFLSSLARIGLSEAWELRLGWAGWSRQRLEVDGRSSVLEGAADGELGAKVRLWNERGATPSAALLFGTSLPVAAQGLGSERFDPSFRFSFSHTLSRSVSLGYNLGMAWSSSDDDDGARHTLSRGIYTVALGISLSDRLAAFVEVYGDVAASDAEPASHAFDGGFTWLVNDTMQLDIAAGLGLNSAAEDWFVGLGFSVRIPH